MADTWDCKTCKTTLRCSCQSMECSFEYDIRAHIRQDLIKAVENALSWMEPKDVMIAVERTIQDQDEPCCDACAEYNG